MRPPEKRSVLGRGVLAFALSTAALAIACSADDRPGRLAADVPDREGFAAPGKVLVARCGSLDCHGSTYRNYRLHGYGSARLDPSHRPDAPGTTDVELALDYDATVGIEPERTRAIAAGREGAGEATLVRKARGTEKHLGGARIVAGSPADRCIVGWLTRTPDDDACATAIDELGAL
jgi:hypothetical protein